MKITDILWIIRGCHSKRSFCTTRILLRNQVKKKIQRFVKLGLKSNPVHRVQPQSLSDKTAMEKKYNCPINVCPPTKN